MVNSLKELAQLLKTNVAECLKKFQETEADSCLEGMEGRTCCSVATEAIADSIALLEEACDAAVSLLEDRDEECRGTVEENLEDIASIAEAFDESGDAILQKKAAAIDEILVAFANRPELITFAKSTSEDEINRLREKMRGPKTSKNPEDKKLAAMRAAVDKKIRRYRPMEAPLSTRYSPDMPGNMLTRIADGVYQDPMTGQIYNHSTGYTTNKGNEIPGYGVEHQLPSSEQNYFEAPFTTREDRLNQ